ncbi:MAG: SDR family NAD(P)-dependent oxidoreductase [Acidimicrobiia bacterium]|nr:SDR family NAD(P)-dependent oxidoreductase [Acidimicrobiia bacterium]
MRELADTVVLVTGSTDGLGRAVAMRLAQGGATVLLHGRDAKKLASTAKELRDASENDRVRTYLADFSSLEDVRAMAHEVEAENHRLHVLVNNAGVGSGKPAGTTRQESADGYELRFAVNHLAGFVLTLRLLPLLRRSAPARVVNVASAGQYSIDFDDVMLERSYDGTRAYRQSKLAQIMFGFDLASRLPAEEVTVNSLHPATFMPTKIVLEQHGHSVDTLEEGIEATWRLAVGEGEEGVTGRYFNRQEDARADDQAYDAEARRRLWDLSVDLTGESPVI